MSLSLLAWSAIDPLRLVWGDAQHPTQVSEGGRGGFELLKSQSAFKAMKMRRFDRITQLAIYLLELTLQHCGEDFDQQDRCEISLVVGTGLGTLETSISCLDQIFDNGDKYCSPMGFMNSVHNSIGANLAQMFDVQGQNMSLVQTQDCFDIALQHASMLLQENPHHLVIVAGIEESGEVLSRILSDTNSVGDCYRGLEGDQCVFMVLGQQKPSPYQIELAPLSRALEPIEGSEHPLTSAQGLLNQIIDLDAGRIHFHRPTSLPVC